MATKSLQANADGTLSEDFDGPHPTMAEREKILLDGLTSQDWDVINAASTEEKRLTTIKIKKGDHAYTVEAFVFPNLAWSSGGRSPHEKRIQLSKDYSDHAEEFSLPKDGDRRCLLLGIYRRQNKTIVCAWDAYSYRDHRNPSSCYVDIAAIADAMRSGIGQSIDGKGRLVCCFRPDLLSYYIENMQMLHERLISAQHAPAEEGPDVLSTAGAALESEPNVVPASMPRNRILYGAPGTGKSHLLETQIQAHFGPGRFERVTFHPDYTYAQFVGSYRPVPLYRPVTEELTTADKLTNAGKFEPVIDYRFVPGPFIRLIVRAIQDPGHSFALVIEELNRANAPAVFGEVFQLLDREESGLGKFSVNLASDARDYMRSEGLSDEVRLPSNLYIWATMNSADQGVLPLDAAFKRRWSFEYLALNTFEEATADWSIKLAFAAEPVKWNAFRLAVNTHLLTRDIPEDRLLGPFFMRKEELESDDAFKNKLLLYLRDDVVRHNPDALFRGESLSYGALVKAYAAGKNIFAEGVAFEGE